MNIKEIKELVEVFDKSTSSSLEIKQDGLEFKITKGAPVASETTPVAAAPVVQSTVVTENPAPVEEPAGEKVLAPLVGVFYAAPSPEEAAYVQVGDHVKAGQILCLIEAMKMMSEITAPCDGVIKQIYAKNQDVVGFEDPLFLIGD
ncbi:MAG: acetyl-CoA carboxylase biotin carboxyl carrier protein [Pseudobutyrivibrio sp.]|nr:acetyl-CoA carboxylase biotin carboxyl carrier protein [Pseudobutyrivibrio sp.]